MRRGLRTGEAGISAAITLPDEPAPYRGLLPFDQQHARFFFGRDADRQRLVDRLTQHPFVAVVSASGSGKSSLAMAGLLLALAVIGPASYLKTRPAIATANLLGGVALAALGWRLYLSLGNTARVNVAPWPRKLVRASLVLLLVQLALGAWLSANFAGLGCTTTDGCMPGRGIGDAFWYLRELALDDNGRVIADQGTAAILIAHRIGAALAVPLLLLTAVMAARASVRLRRNALLVLALVSLQAMLGLCALAFSLPLAVVLAHSTVAVSYTHLTLPTSDLV